LGVAWLFGDHERGVVHVLLLICGVVRARIVVGWVFYVVSFSVFCFVAMCGGVAVLCAVVWALYVVCLCACALSLVCLLRFVVLMCVGWGYGDDSMVVADLVLWTGCWWLCLGDGLAVAMFLCWVWM